MDFWRAIGKLEGGLASVGAGLSLLAMILITVMSVIGRYVLHMDVIPGAYNLVERVSFPLIVFWAVPMAHRDGLFPRFDLLVNSLPKRLGHYVNAFVLLVEFVIFVVIIWYVLRFAWNSVEIKRTMQIGTDFWIAWPIIIMMPLGFLLMMLEMLRLIWRELRGKGGDAASENDNVSAAF